jgi:uncharacterized protein (DUF1697 family)
MTRQVCLLRGVNVGGSGRLPMADFRDLLSGLGLAGVQTYIQSGNAVCSADDPPGLLGPRIAAAIAARFGFRPPLFLVTAGELSAILRDNPFDDGDPARVQVILLAAPRPELDRGAVAALAAADEAWHVTDRAFYLHALSGFGRSRLAARLDRLLGPDSTGRNLRTLRALQAMTGAGA